MLTFKAQGFLSILFHCLGWLLCENLKALGNGILFPLYLQDLLVIVTLSECLVFAMTLGMTRASLAQLWEAASADRAPFLHSPTPPPLPPCPVLELCADWLEHGPWLACGHSPIPSGWFIPMLGASGVHWSSVQCACVLSSFSCVQLFVTPWVIAC